METGKAWSTAITLTATLGELRRVVQRNCTMLKEYQVIHNLYLWTNATITVGRVRPTNKHTTLDFGELSTYIFEIVCTIYSIKRGFFFFNLFVLSYCTSDVQYTIYTDPFCIFIVHIKSQNCLFEMVSLYHLPHGHFLMYCFVWWQISDIFSHFNESVTLEWVKNDEALINLK